MQRLLKNKKILIINNKLKKYAITNKNNHHKHILLNINF